MVDHHNLTGYSQVVEELDATGAVVATYHYGHDLISQSRLVVDETTGASEWVDRIFLYDGFSQVGAVSGAVGGEEECGRAPESLAPQAGFLRDASGSHVGAYAPLESPLQFPLLASIPLRENKGGSVRALTDLEGNITDTFSYDAYGNLLGYSLSAIGDCPTFYLYRGERWDPDLGQYYLRARFYDANLGRFHTLDDYEGRTGEPLSLHKYLYAHANPVTGWDPSGRMALVGTAYGNTIYAGLASLSIPSLGAITRTLGLALIAILVNMAVTDGTSADVFEMGRKQSNEIVDRARELQESLAKGMGICAAIDALEIAMKREFEPNALPGSYRVLFKQARKYMKCPGGNPNKTRGGPNK